MARILCCLCLLSFSFQNVASSEIINTHEPYSYEVLERDLKELKAVYPKELTIKKIGLTHFNRSIYAVKLGKGEQNIVLIGSHHGREWLTSMLLMKKLETYTKAYQCNEKLNNIPIKLLDEVSIWFIPMLNPDGVTIQQNNLSLFPVKHREKLKNMNQGSDHFERWKANGMGVDLNRQYPAGWKRLGKEPTKPYYQFYKGKKPLEANEVKILTTFIHDIDPLVAVAYHSAGREVYWNYFNGKHLLRDRQIAMKIAKLTKYKLAKPPKHAVGAGFTDWFITDYHRPAMTIEISPLVGEASPPLSVFKEEWQRNQFVGITLVKEARKLFHNKQH
jgi:g-D-glutamyl-meso-diaminopimelate peptidase